MPGLALEEALGPEAQRVGVDVGPAVDQVGAGAIQVPAGERVAAELHRRGELPQHDRQHRAQAQGLLDDRVGVGVLAGRGLLAHPLQLVGMAEQPLEAQASSSRSTRGRRSAG